LRLHHNMPLLQKKRWVSGIVLLQNTLKNQTLFKPFAADETGDAKQKTVSAFCPSGTLPL
ncbi:hypothetical protein ACFL43_06360, partial [Thermodesulfobacteriota bacterium]